MDTSCVTMIEGELREKNKMNEAHESIFRMIEEYDGKLTVAYSHQDTEDNAVYIAKVTTWDLPIRVEGFPVDQILRELDGRVKAYIKREVP